ncbi:CPBP family intramembrane glutamic endopeptidase [Frateuria hangzhouensis]|uniref:CPBP family intramembrane glutamic endopeptidase n=1 Tax=Frateuria hangzhouensis TaxID=2995589 RepID=UPI0022610470|nr:CPBP family intramembrane glutamic endopeptidase [Frateuria sp. STR12]MCX7512149.1 CPBP family intramembrane metalloprotease [Frateuria sp. STR12]
MNRPLALLPWLLGFVVLDLYANLVPRLVGVAVPVWLAYVGGFFVLAFLICRYGLGITRSASLGLARPAGWGRWLGAGFAIGFGIWALKNGVFWAMGKFELVGWRDAGFALPLLGKALFGMFFAAAINDLMIRGYGLAFCRRFELMRWYVLLTVVVYALDDSWNEGIDAGNLVFSAILGLSLAWTVLRTGTLWMAIGIHWGGNVCYRLMSGFDGQGVPRLQHVLDGTRFEYAALAVTALMFPLVAWVLRWMGQSATGSVTVEGVRASDELRPG